MNGIVVYSPNVLSDEDIEEFLHMVQTYAPDTIVQDLTASMMITSEEEKEDREYTIIRKGRPNFLSIIRNPDYYLLHEEETLQEIGYQPRTCLSINFPIDDVTSELMQDIVGLFASRWTCTFKTDRVDDEKRFFHQDEILRSWKNDERYY